MREHAEFDCSHCGCERHYKRCKNDGCTVSWTEQRRTPADVEREMGERVDTLVTRILGWTPYACDMTGDEAERARRELGVIIKQDPLVDELQRARAVIHDITAIRDEHRDCELEVEDGLERGCSLLSELNERLQKYEQGE